MARYTSPAKFRATKLRLASEWPIDWSFSVQTRPFGTIKKDGYRCFGLCRWNDSKSRFDLFIERNDDAAVMVDTLIHEYTHLRTWRDNGRKDHPQDFWIELGKITNSHNGE